MAAREGKDDVIEMLSTQKGFEGVVNILDNDGRNAIFSCIASSEKGNKYLSRVEKLINCGANLAIEDIHSWTVLSYACLRGTKEVVSLLIENGADVNQRPTDGWTPLLIAVLEENEDMTEILLEKGANANACTEDSGDTALHLASRSGYVDIVGRLLKSGADPGLRNKESQTALKLATEQDSDDCRLVSLLIRMEVLKDLDDGEKDSGIAGVATATDWKTLSLLLDKIAWEGDYNKSLKEKLALTCLATDPYRSSDRILCARLSDKLRKSEQHEQWTGLHWATYVGYSNLVLW